MCQRLLWPAWHTRLHTGHQHAASQLLLLQAGQRSAQVFSFRQGTPSGISGNQALPMGIRGPPLRAGERSQAFVLRLTPVIRCLDTSPAVTAELHCKSSPRRSSTWQDATTLWLTRSQDQRRPSYQQVLTVGQRIFNSSSIHTWRILA